MRMELQYNAAADAPVTFPPSLTSRTASPNILETPPFSIDVTPPITPPFVNRGIRQAIYTPLAAAMQFSLNYFRNTVLPIAGTPPATAGRPGQTEAVRDSPVRR